jgi:putative tricarboxylic transport membrane protein
MQMKRHDLIGGGIVFLFGGITAAFSLQMPIGTFRMAGSGLFPLCLGILLMFLSLLFLLNLLFGKKATPQTGEPAAATPANAKLVLQFLTVTAAATLCLRFLGYPAFCFLIMLFLLRILGIRRPALLLGISVLTAACAYLLFVWFLKIPLPKGWIGL